MIVLFVFIVCVEFFNLKETKTEKKRVVHRCGRKLLKLFSWFHNLEFCLNGKLSISEIGKIQL